MACYTVSRFTYVSWSDYTKFRLRPKIFQKMKSFFFILLHCFQDNFISVQKTKLTSVTVVNCFHERLQLASQTDHSRSSVDVLLQTVAVKFPQQVWHLSASFISSLSTPSPTLMLTVADRLLRCLAQFLTHCFHLSCMSTASGSSQFGSRRERNKWFLYNTHNHNIASSFSDILDSWDYKVLLQCAATTRMRAHSTKLSFLGYKQN